MAELSAEQFAQRAFHTGVLDERQLDAVWAEFRTRDVALNELSTLLLRKELVTNYQVEKLVRGDRTGYFYGDYKILWRAGVGTFARVFRAVNMKTGREVAVKVLRKRWCEDPEKTEQFLREGQMGASLRHPSIVPIYEVHSIKSDYFLVMEFVEGQNLRHFVRARGKVEPIETARLILDMCSGLAHAFEHGITHRDLKLSNVLLSVKKGIRARLVDFGLAAVGGGRMSDDALSQFPNPRTIDYAALERATGVRKDDKRSDIYFTGCIMYHLLTGQAPLRETKERSQRLSITRFEEIVPISKLLPELPTPFTVAVNRAMELNPSRRFQTPAEMRDSIQEAIRKVENDEDDVSATKVESTATPTKTVQQEGKGKSVLVVESDAKMQDVFRNQLKKHGYRVLIIGDPQRAMERFQDQHVADCVIFSSNEIGEPALSAFNDFGRLERTRHIPAILLLSEKQRSWESKAKRAAHRCVIAMPVQMQQLRKMLLEAIDNGQQEAN